jgi:hypothetical protein
VRGRGRVRLESSSFSGGEVGVQQEGGVGCGFADGEGSRRSGGGSMGWGGGSRRIGSKGGTLSVGEVLVGEEGGVGDVVLVRGGRRWRRRRSRECSDGRVGHGFGEGDELVEELMWDASRKRWISMHEGMEKGIG